MTTLEKLIYLREHGVSMTYLAKKVKCAPQTISHWVKGEKNISQRLEKDLEYAIIELAEEMEVLK